MEPQIFNVACDVIIDVEKSLYMIYRKEILKYRKTNYKQSVVDEYNRLYYQLISDDPNTTERFKLFSPHSLVCVLETAFAATIEFSSKIDIDYLNVATAADYIDGIEEQLTELVEMINDSGLINMEHECDREDIKNYNPNIPLFN